MATSFSSDATPRRVIAITPVPTSAEAEVARALHICNACRYCEGFCAVFPAMTRRLEFPQADIHYLANLCHNCGACLHACQYAPPHAFAVNIPQAMATVRAHTYAQYAWPAPLGRLYERNGLTLAVALVVSLTLFLLMVVLQGAGTQALWGSAAPASFYEVFGHTTLVKLFAPVFAFVVLALGLGVRRFLRTIGPATSNAPASTEAAMQATRDAMTLRYLDGGHGEGCHNDDDAYTLSRRTFHQFTMYGFALCFAATGVATLYHYLWGWSAPYDLPSLPKLLGIAGGMAMVVGTAGLWRLHRRRHPLHGNARQKPMDLGFIALLFAVATSGLALWLSRGTSVMPLLLCLHLGSVMALFVTLPYGKFAHSVFRAASLLRYAVERRQPDPIGLGSD